MRRPRLRRKRLGKAKAGATPAKVRGRRSGGKTPSPVRPKPKLPKDVGFRTTTRIKAVGYGLREQTWRLTRGWDKLEGRLRRLWAGRSAGVRKRILTVLGVVALYLLVKFVPIPGAPCQISPAKECAPGDDAVALVPADALLYGHLTLDKSAGEYDRAGLLFGRFARFSALGEAALGIFHTPSGAQLTFPEIRSWAGNDAAVTILPGKAPPAPKKGGPRTPPGNASAVMISVANQNGAQAFVRKIAPGPAKTSQLDGVTLSAHPGGFDSAIADGFVLLGADAAVRALVATGAGKAKNLAAEPTAAAIRGGLPANRLADVYLSGQGVQRLLAGSTSTASTQLETFVDYSATRGFAAAAVARDQGIEVDLVSSLDQAKAKTSPSFFSELPKFHPNLTHFVGSRAMAYLGIGDAGQSLGDVLKLASSAQPALAQALTGFTQRLEQQAKVDPTKDLLPALGGQAALVAEPTDGIPFASLIVDGVDEAKARDAMARLQGPIVQAISSSPDQKLPNFTTTTIDGVHASELLVSPTVTLTYAVFDGKLVISTQPAGIAQVKKGSDRLTEASAFTTATGPLPDEVSALVFLNLDELLNLAESLGRVQDPLYASFRDDIRKLHAIAVGVNAGGHELRSRLFVTIK